MDMKLVDSRVDEHSCDQKDMTKLTWTVPVEGGSAAPVAETDQQDDVTKLPWTTPIKG